MSVAACGGGMGGSDDNGDDKKMRVHVDFVASSDGGADDADDERTDEDDEITDSKVERRNSDFRLLTLSDSDAHPSLPPKHKRKMSKYYVGKARSMESLKEMGPSIKKRRLSTDTVYPIHKISGASSAPLLALPKIDEAQDDVDVDVDIVGLSDDEVGKKKKKKKKRRRSKKSKKESEGSNSPTLSQEDEN